MQEFAQLAQAGAAHAAMLDSAQDTFAANSAARGAVGKHIGALAEQLNAIDGALLRVQGVSRQVTLIAMNASIEAARAGEAGKGFAVVAQEVGDLARNIGAAVQDVESNMASMQALLRDTSQNMDDAKKMGGAFNEELEKCVAGAAELSRMIAELARTLPPDA